MADSQNKRKSLEDREGKKRQVLDGRSATIESPEVDLVKLWQDSISHLTTMKFENEEQAVNATIDEVLLRLFGNDEQSSATREFLQQVVEDDETLRASILSALGVKN